MAMIPRPDPQQVFEDAFLKTCTLSDRLFQGVKAVADKATLEWIAVALKESVETSKAAANRLPNNQAAFSIDMVLRHTEDDLRDFRSSLDDAPATRAASYHLADRINQAFLHVIPRENQTFYSRLDQETGRAVRDADQ